MRTFCFIAFLSVMSFAVDVAPFLDPSEPASLKKWALLWNDEFDDEKTIDSNWIPQNGSAGKILSSRWRENISVREGLAIITNRKESRGGREWTSGSMTCKREFGYGYFESRFEISAASGVNNSFWLYQGRATDSLKSFEVDIVEGHYPDVFFTNIHDFGLSGEKVHTQNSKSFVSKDSDLYTSFHIYGLEWNEQKMIFYFDGKKIRELDNQVCFQNAYLIVGTAILKWAGKITSAIDNTTMKIDYIRVWEESK